MKKSYILFIIFIIFCVYSCNNNYTIGPTNPHANSYDTVFFQSFDTFSVHLHGIYDTIANIIDTFVQRDTIFNLALNDQKEIVLTYDGITNHPQNNAYIDSAVNIRIALYDSARTDSVIYEDLDSLHVARSNYFDTYRHSALKFAQCGIRLRINHNHHYNDGDYFVKLENLRFYKVILK